MKDLGKAIASLRKMKGWTQQRLADEIGTKRHYICIIENGSYGSPPSGRMLLKIADALGCTLSMIPKFK